MIKYSAAIRLIISDYKESPYSDFEQYWDDHRTHYRIELGATYTEIYEELVKMGYLIE